MAPNPKPAPGDIPSWFAGKTMADLDAIEAGGLLYFPESLRKMNAKGELVGTPVVVRVPTRRDRALARLDAMKHVAEITKKKIETVEQAQAAIGAEVFEEIDSVAIVARCTFEPRGVDAGPDWQPQQFMLLGVMLGSYVASSIYDLFWRLDFYDKLINVRAEDISDDDFWSVIGKIAEVRNLSPLAVIGPSQQTNCFVRAATELSSYRTLKSSSPSIDTSTAGS